MNDPYKMTVVWIICAWLVGVPGMFVYMSINGQVRAEQMRNEAASTPQKELTVEQNPLSKN